MPFDQTMPKSAFLAVTLLCNSRCVMCDIWKNKGMDFLPVDIYSKLPNSLEMIDITGGEPFLRPDIPEVVSRLKEACPKARLLITTHGFMTEKIEGQIHALLKADPEIAFRVSLDGLGKVHDEIRRIPGGFEKVMQTIELLRRTKVKDLGIIFTLMEKNRSQLKGIYQYCQEKKLSFTLNTVHDSPVYFGNEKTNLNAKPAEVKKDFAYLFWQELKNANPKDWGKAWFVMALYRYMGTHRRSIPCGAGEKFFYMDSAANIYMCNFKNWPIGNLNVSSFEVIWNSPAKKNYVPLAHQCHDCWSICTAKDAIKSDPWTVIKQTPQLIKEMFL